MTMKIRTFAVAALAAGLLITASCKKDSSTASYNYLSGSIRFSIPVYVAAGEVLDVTPTGISHPDDEPFGYYWTVSVLKTSRDTSKYAVPDGGTGRFRYTVPDTIGVFTLTVSAFADDYYPTTASSTFEILHPTRSLTETGIAIMDPRFTDGRDGISYAYIHAGGLDWMRENLRYAGAGVSYDGCAAADPVFGRYYSYTEAVAACPAGWRLPTDADWAALVSESSAATVSAGETFPEGSGSLMSRGCLNTAKLWEYWPAVNITDAVGFCALPAGYANLSATDRNLFPAIGEYAAFWTADETAAGAAYRYINVHRPEVYLGTGDQRTFAASVRCVK